MNFECIIYEKPEGVAVIRLNRPQVLNAMNKRLWLDMQAALDDARTDEQIKVVVAGYSDLGVYSGGRHHRRGARFFDRGRPQGIQDPHHRGLSGLFDGAPGSVAGGHSF